MAMIRFGDYYINPKHVSCVGVREESTSGRVGEAKYWYEVFVVCYSQKIVRSYTTRREADEVVDRIVTHLNQLEERR